MVLILKEEGMAGGIERGVYMSVVTALETVFTRTFLKALLLA